MGKRIRVFFINCPTLAVEAATYLLLAQNKVQSFFQFEVHHFWLYSLDQYSDARNSAYRLWIANHDDFLQRFFWWLGGGRIVRSNRANLDLQAARHFSKEFDLNTCFTDTRAVLRKYDDWMARRRERGANNYDAMPAPEIIVTETRLPHNFISHISPDRTLGIVSLGGWKRYFRPGSALECILTGVQRIAVALCCSPTIGFHYPTRGCLFDYTRYVQDTRVGAFLGFLCETCQQDLKRSISNVEYEDVVRLIENEWIGRRDSHDSVAHVLSRIYKYDLSRSTGLRPRFKDEIIRSVQSESGRVFWLLGIGAVVILLAAYAPWIRQLLTLL